MKRGESVVIPTGPFAGQIGEVVEILENKGIVKVALGNGMRVNVPLDILDTIEKVERETEAEARRPKTRKGKDEEGVREERPRNRNRSQPRKESLLSTPTPQPEPTATPVTARIRMIEKKEAKVKQTRIVTQDTQPARVEPLYCPVCPPDQPPKIRRKPTDIACGDCYRQYTNEAAVGLAKGAFIAIFDWVAGKAPAMLATLEEQLTSAGAEVKKLQDEVGEEVYQSLKASTGGKQVPREVWNQAFRVRQKELWRQRGGNVKFAKMKGLEGRIALLKSIIEKSQEPKPAPTAETAAAKTTEAAAKATTPATETAPPATIETPPPPAKGTEEKKVAKPPRKRTAKAAK